LAEGRQAQVIRSCPMTLGRGIETSAVGG